jgi:hypothetical protein
VPQIIERKQKTITKKNSQDSPILMNENVTLTKTAFQIERENGISVEQLKENLLKRVRQLWEK